MSSKLGLAGTACSGIFLATPVTVTTINQIVQESDLLATPVTVTTINCNQIVQESDLTISWSRWRRHNSKKKG